MASRNLISAVEWTKTLTTDVDVAVEKNKSHFVGEEIKGKVLAVIGLGYIGVMVANAAKELGMRVVGYDPYISVKSAHELLPSVRLYDSLETLLPHCDFVTVHVPATEETKGMISYELLDIMKNKAVLLNFARDSLVNSTDLLRALSEKKLRLYITDFPTDALIGVENVIMIPHLGASTKESEENCAIMAVEQLMNYIEHGMIENSVNYPTCTPGVKTSQMRILVMNKNIPTILGKLTGALAARNININKLVNKSKGDNAYTVIDADETVDADEIRRVFDFEGVVSVRVI
jgi:D-3-phosphoglycerate dehydrogenase